MRTTISPEEALTIVEKYNKEPFHIRHAITVSEVLGNLATVLGYGDESAYWASVGMLHDVDFELYGLSIEDIAVVRSAFSLAQKKNGAEHIEADSNLNKLVAAAEKSAACCERVVL